MTITVTYSAIDGCRSIKKYKTIAGARKYATERVGKYPELGFSYAVSADGIGKIEVAGCSLHELFNACPDCGQIDAARGHMGCDYPSNN